MLKFILFFLKYCDGLVNTDHKIMKRRRATEIITMKPKHRSKSGTAGSCRWKKIETTTKNIIKKYRKALKKKKIELSTENINNLRLIRKEKRNVDITLRNLNRESIETTSTNSPAGEEQDGRDALYTNPTMNILNLEIENTKK